MQFELDVIEPITLQAPESMVRITAARRGCSVAAHGFIARSRQAIDATLVPALRQRLGAEGKECLAQGQEPDWIEAQRRQMDTNATSTKKHGKIHPQRELESKAQLQPQDRYRHEQRAPWPPVGEVLIAAK